MDLHANHLHDLLHDLATRYGGNEGPAWRCARDGSLDGAQDHAFAVFSCSLHVRTKSQLDFAVKMAEVAGLVVGGVSLAALFDQCISIINYVDSGIHCGDAYQDAALMLALWAVV